MPFNTIEDVRKVLSRVSFKDWLFNVNLMGDGFYLQVEFMTPCHNTGVMEPQKGGKWYISRHSTEGELVQRALKAVLTALEHEAREQFKYMDVAIFQPHMDLDLLLTAAHKKVVREHDATAINSQGPFSKAGPPQHVLNNPVIGGRYPQYSKPGAYSAQKEINSID